LVMPLAMINYKARRERKKLYLLIPLRPNLDRRFTSSHWVSNYHAFLILTSSLKTRGCLYTWVESRNCAYSHCLHKVSRYICCQ
jgi:hypothetical protein